MSRSLSPGQRQNHVWLVAVPKRQAFTQPQFHFGERVQWQIANRLPNWQVGQIVGMEFTETAWQYFIEVDRNSLSTAELPSKHYVAEQHLRLVKCAGSARERLQGEPEWFLTEPAAFKLGVSAEQLRKLRRKGLFKNGHHYRDISVPGSGLPRWQWHVERCGKALEIAPEKRSAYK